MSYVREPDYDRYILRGPKEQPEYYKCPNCGEYIYDDEYDSDNERCIHCQEDETI